MRTSKSKSSRVGVDDDEADSTMAAANDGRLQSLLSACSSLADKTQRRHNPPSHNNDARGARRTRPKRRHKNADDEGDRTSRRTLWILLIVFPHPRLRHPAIRTGRYSVRIHPRLGRWRVVRFAQRHRIQVTSRIQVLADNRSPTEFGAGRPLLLEVPIRRVDYRLTSPPAMSADMRHRISTPPTPLSRWVCSAQWMFYDVQKAAKRTAAMILPGLRDPTVRANGASYTQSSATSDFRGGETSSPSKPVRNAFSSMASRRFPVNEQQGQHLEVSLLRRPWRQQTTTPSSSRVRDSRHRPHPLQAAHHGHLVSPR